MSKIITYFRLNIFKIITIFTFLLSIFIFNIIFIKYHSNYIVTYIVVMIILIIYFIFILLFIRLYINYSKIKNKYLVSLECLCEYEDLINKYRVLNHENRNQLLVIRNMDNYKVAKKYIDQLIDNKDSEDKSIDKIIKKIPSTHLKAVFYSKLNKMKNNNINYSVVINRNVTSKIFLGIDDNTLLDMCNIVNIILDNSIDESINSRDRQILINIYKNESIKIVISNSYNNTIDLGKIYDMGFSTKGSGHGYGLSFAKEIVYKNKKITNETELDDKYFTQIITIST